MRSSVGKDCRECPDTERSMLGNRKMMLAVLLGGKSKMAAGLAGD